MKIVRNKDRTEKELKKTPKNPPKKNQCSQKNLERPSGSLEITDCI